MLVTRPVPPAVDHVAELAVAVEAHRTSQRALEDAKRRRAESRRLAADLRSQRTANRFAERIAETFRE